MASKYEEKKEVCDVSGPSSTQPDVVSLRLEVDDDLCPLPPSVQELEFNSAPETQYPVEAPHSNATASNVNDALKLLNCNQKHYDL